MVRDKNRLGESAGEPRLVQPVGDQLADWQAAIEFAATLPGVVSARLAIWGFSATGGHLFPVAARNPGLAAVIAQTPSVGGLASMRSASRHQKPLAMLRFTVHGVLDTLGGLIGRSPRLVPLAGRPGTTSMLTTPDAQDGSRALEATSYPDWQQAVAARSALRLAFYRPGRYASQVRSPLLVVLCDDDQTTPAELSTRVSRQAPRADVIRLAGGHYAPFREAHEQAVAAQVSFLNRYLLSVAETVAP